MSAIAVTGAAGAVGQRTLRQLSSDQSIERLVALDRRPTSFRNRAIETHKLNLASEPSDRLAEILAGIDSLIHLAGHAARRADAADVAGVLSATLEAAGAAGVAHVVFLSSGTVYGAHPDNPVPLTETEPARPNEALAFAVSKLELEQLAIQWAEADDDRSVALLRPTTTLSESGVSWVAKAMRAATTVRPDQADPPVQFLHHDDLASALSFVTRRRLDGLFNVAPDGWIGPEEFRELIGGVRVRVPVALNDRLLEAGRRVGVRPTPEGIEPYVRHSWVLANDRLRNAGWTPAFSNQEAYILGTPPPPWSVSAQRRQELALGVAGVAVAGAAAAATSVARRFTRSHIPGALDLGLRVVLPFADHDRRGPLFVVGDHFEGELAACHDAGTLDAHPAAIELAAGVEGIGILLVDGRVEQHDHRAADEQRPRHVDGLAVAARDA